MGNARPRPARLAEKLLAIRHKLGMSQGELGRVLKLEYHRISEFESGGRDPSLILLLRYARAAKVSVESVIDDEMELSSSRYRRGP